MSQTIENRIVEMQFENKQFESGVQESLSTLDKLKNSLKFEDASKNLQEFNKNITKNMDFSQVESGIEKLADKFSVSGIAGMEAIRKLTDFALEAGKKIALALDAPFAQIRSGGWKRAMNIEDAKFQLKGLGVTWESVYKDIDFAVSGTAFGLDAAAKACGQLSASGIQAGNDMKYALRAISGVAAMGNTEFENITDIFTKVAGNGRVMASELNRVSQYGLNARAALVSFFNDINSGADKLQKYEVPETVQEYVKSITDGTKIIEADIGELVRKGEVDFKTFAYAMDYAFGEHAKAANETFMGALRNIKAALSKIGAEFATPIIQGAIPVFNEIRIFLNDIRKQMGPIFDTFEGFANFISKKLTSKLKEFRLAFLGEDGFAQPIKNLMDSFLNIRTAIIKIIATIVTAYKSVFPETKNLEESLENTTGFISKLTEHLIPSNEALSLFCNIMKVLFSILKSVGSVISNLLPIMGQGLAIVLKIVSVVGYLLAGLIGLISNLQIVKNVMIGIQNAGGLLAYAIERVKDAFYYLKDILTDTTTLTGQVFTRLADSATTVAYIIGGILYLSVIKIRDAFAYFDTHDPLGSLVDGVQKLVNIIKEVPIIKEIATGLEIAFGVVATVINKIIELVVDFISKIKEGQTVFQALGSTAELVLGGIITGFNKLSDTVRGWFGIFSDNDKVIEETIESPMYGANAAMTATVKTLVKTGSQIEDTTRTMDRSSSSIANFGARFLEVVRNFDYGKLILSAYATMLLIIAYNSNNLIISISKLATKLSGGFFNLFKTGKTKFERFAIGVMQITGSIIALAAALWALSKVPENKLKTVTDCLFKLLATVGVFSLLATGISQLTHAMNGTGFSSFSSNMLMMAGGIIALVAALKMLESLNLTGWNLWEKVIVIGAMAAALATLSVIMSKVAPQLTMGSIFMLAFAGATLILVKALDNLSKVTLDGLAENWDVLTIIILSFAAFAALAGTVGVSSLISLMGFILGMQVLIKNIDPILDAMKKYQVGAVIAGFFEGMKDDIKKVLAYVSTMSDVTKATLVVLTTGFLSSLLAMSIILKKASTSIIKMGVTALMISAGIVGLMYATVKIADMCKSISSGDIISAIGILGLIGILIGAIIGITAKCAGDTTGESAESFGGMFGKKMVTKSKGGLNKSNSLKQARKMLLDMGLLIASVALFVSVVGKMTPDEVSRANGLLLEVMIIMGVIMSLIAFLASRSKDASGSSASIVMFIGVIGVLGSLLGSFVVLMNQFKGFHWQTQGAQLAAALISLGAIIVGVIAIIAVLKRKVNEDKSSGLRALLGFSALISAIGLVVYGLMTVVKNENDLKRAITIAGTLAGFLGVAVTLVGIMTWFSTILAKIEGRTEAFKKEVKALGVMIATIAAIGAILIGLEYFGSDNIIKNAATLTVVLIALVTLVEVMAWFAKKTTHTITKTSWKTIQKLFIMIGEFIIGMMLLSNIFIAMKDLDWKMMAIQSGILLGTLLALEGLAIGMLVFVKKFKAGWGDIAKSGVIFTAMIAMFTGLSLVFKYIISEIPTEGVNEKVKAIVQTMLVLEGLMAIAAILGNFWKQLGAGELGFAGMVGLFHWMAYIFTIIGEIEVAGFESKKDTIISAMWSLIGILTVLGIIGAIMVGTGGVAALMAAAGLAAMSAMVGIFQWVSSIFETIGGIEVAGFESKKDTIISAMWSLVGILSVLGLASPLGLLALVSMPGLLLCIYGISNIVDALNAIQISDTNQMQEMVDALKSMMWGLIGMLSVMGLLSPLILISLAAMPSLLTVISGLKDISIALSLADGLSNEQMQATVDVMKNLLWGLVGILTVMGILSPLIAASVIAMPGLIEIIKSLVTMSISIKVLETMNPERAKQAIDVLIDMLWDLIGLGAVNGVLNGIGGALEDIAEGIKELGSACIEATTGAMSFNTAIMMLNASLVSASSTLGNTASDLAETFKTSFDGVLEPETWGQEIAEELATGIESGRPSVANAAKNLAHAIYQYLHFSEGADIGDLKAPNVRTWGGEIPKEYALGIDSTSDMAGLSAGEMAEKVAGKIIDPKIVEEVKKHGSDVGHAFVGWIRNSMLADIPQVESLCNYIEGLFAQVKADYSRGAGVLDAYTPQIRRNIRTTTEQIARARETIAKTNPAIKGGTQAIQEAKKTIEKLEPELKANKDLLNDIQNGTVGAAEGTEELTDAFVGLGDGGGKAAAGAAEARDAVADFYDMIENSISLFDKFEEEEAMSSEELLENMASQITGIANWSNQIQELATKGIDLGLLQKLADMGPSGQKYVAAFVNMTADQLAQANSLYQQSLLLPQHVTAQVFSSFSLAGQNATEGFVNGLDHDEVREQGIAFAHSFLDNFNEALGIHSPSDETFKSAMYAILGFIEGTESMTYLLETTIEELARKILMWFDTELGISFGISTKTVDVGKALVDGIREGIESSDAQSKLFDSIKRFGDTILEKLNDIKRRASEVGENITEGISEGANNGVSSSSTKIDQTSNGIVDGMRKTIEKANNALSSGIEDPVIKPVLDLSDVQNGSREINSMLSQTKAYQASGSFSNLQNQQWNSQNALLRATMDNGEVVNAIGNLSDDIASLKEAMTNINMVLDTGVLVGAMAPTMDKRLGVRKMYAERGM